MSKKKLPLKVEELFCFRCGKKLIFTGLDSGEYLIFECPECKVWIGVRGVRGGEQVD